MIKFLGNLQTIVLAITLLSLPLAHAAGDTNSVTIDQKPAVITEQQVTVTSWADYAQQKAALKAQKKSKVITKAEFKKKKKELKAAYKTYKKEVREKYKAKRKALREKRKALKEQERILKAERKALKKKEKEEKRALKEKMNAEKRAQELKD